MRSPRNKGLGATRGGYSDASTNIPSWSGGASAKGGDLGLILPLMQKLHCSLCPANNTI